jgi:hypothetical protein
MLSHRGLFLVVCVAAASLTGAGDAVAAAPASLQGEHFVGSGTLTRACSDAFSGTGEFSLTGTATGPYPGAFTETGSAALAGGNVTALHVSFTIDSPSTSTTISGTKDLVLGAGSCELLVGSPQQVSLYQTDAQVTYAAILHRAQGAFSDSGTGFFSLEADAPGATVPTIFFDETFDTSNGVLPADKAACKNGGYRDFPQFKNQGDCVSFVTTAGKNPPSGS